jgi:hypothetical protein
MVILIILAKKKPKVINCILGKSLLRFSIDSRLNFLYICRLTLKFNCFCSAKRLVLVLSKVL